MVGVFSSLKIKKEGKESREKKRNRRQEGNRKKSERMNNDTSRKDLDEHAVLRLTWPAEMMWIPAKLSFRQA